TGMSSPASPPHHLQPRAYEPFPKDADFTNLSNIGMFASRPASRGRSRSSSGAINLSMLRSITLDSTASLDEVSRKIRGAMAERRRRRRRKTEGDSDWTGHSETEESVMSDNALKEEYEEVDYNVNDHPEEGKKDV